MDVTQSVVGKPPTRRQLAAQETRRKLLEAALENFSRRPYADVTVADIARSAGVAHGLLSHHFNGKENLYAEVVGVIDQRLRAAAKIGSDGPVVERLRRHLAAHLRFLAENEDAALNLILRRADTTDAAWKAFETTSQEGIRAICGLLGLDADAPALRLTMRGFSAACDETALVWLRSGRPYEIEALVDVFVAFLTGAIRAACDLAPAPVLREALEVLQSEVSDG
ncbi:TetR/AcrR family transcriptional regulator [Streptosporangium sp. NPDC049046]|uniref:TetR/AcrR family transcriptional regulator n=1 Tax=unclassified Streptosporangium TaxID=2632669 RepID=UPI00343FE772